MRFILAPCFKTSVTLVSNWQTFYRAMHHSAKGGIAIACRPSVRLSVCDRDVCGPGAHRSNGVSRNCPDF